jgi:ABC-2 type transport system ATP-binding protein
MLSTLVEPDEGLIAVGGYDLRKQRRQAKPLIGVVPQDIALYPTLSARANLEFFGSMYGLRGAILRARVDEVLRAVGLLDRANDAVQTYSGGMKRRVNIAAGLLHRPRIIFLDEPTVGVDPQSRNFIFEHVERLKAEGMAVIYTTHYMEEAERLCDRTAIVNDGQVIAQGTLAELLARLGGGAIRIGLREDDIPRVIAEIAALPQVSAAETRGGVIEVRSAAAETRGGVIEVRSAAAEPRGGVIEVRSAAGDEDLRGVLDICARAGASVQSLELLKPNLESVFLMLTGKKLRD